jgi:hypothetical protein
MYLSLTSLVMSMKFTIFVTYLVKKMLNVLHEMLICECLNYYVSKHYYALFNV